MLDRLSLSQKNHWIDEENNVYLIFTREKVQEKLNLSDKTVTKSFKILMEVNLVQEKRQGLGKPNLIYVGKINLVLTMTRSKPLFTEAMFGITKQFLDTK